MFQPTPKLDAIPGIQIPIVPEDWTPAVINGMRLFMQPSGIAPYLDAADYEHALGDAWSNAPLVTVPFDDAREYQPWGMHPGLVPQASSAVIINVVAGVPIAQNLTPNTAGGSTGGNPPETTVVPGSGTVPLTTVLLGGADFANWFYEYGGHLLNGVAELRWKQSAGAGFDQPNFSLASGRLAQIPLGWFRLGTNDVGLGKYVPYITGAGKVRLVARAAVEKLGKFGVALPTPTAAPKYINDAAMTGAAVEALWNAGLRGASMGAAINEVARKVM